MLIVGRSVNGVAPYVEPMNHARVVIGVAGGKGSRMGGGRGGGARKPDWFGPREPSAKHAVLRGVIGMEAVSADVGIDRRRRVPKCYPTLGVTELANVGEG